MNILSQENLLAKTIIGGFVMYMGYIFVQRMQVQTFSLIYAIVVLVVGWQWFNQVQRAKKKYYKQNGIRLRRRR